MWRERASKLYSVLPWVESMQDVEIPWIMLQTLISSIITYFMIQFEFDFAKFMFFWLVQFLSCATLGYLGMLVVCITPDLTMAVTIGSSILGAWFMMSGALHMLTDSVLAPFPEVCAAWCVVTHVSLQRCGLLRSQLLRCGLLRLRSCTTASVDLMLRVCMLASSRACSEQA